MTGWFLSYLVAAAPAASFGVTWIILAALLCTFSDRILDELNDRSLYRQPVPRMGGSWGDGWYCRGHSVGFGGWVVASLARCRAALLVGLSSLMTLLVYDRCAFHYAFRMRQV
jgi:hypothetical protein